MENNHIFPFLWMRGEEESVLRREMEMIHNCGIGAVCLEARPHDDFCGPGWWHDFDIILDEAKKRDMKIWILDDKHFPTGYANGLIRDKYPERKKQYIRSTVAEYYGESCPITLDVKRMLKPFTGFWEIGQDKNAAERANNSLLSLVAVRLAEGDELEEEVIDLTDSFDGHLANFELPAGRWRVYVFFKTRTDGGDEDYINMLDSISAYTQIEGVYEPHFARYGDEFGKTIAGFFSDEPEIGNTQRFERNVRLGHPKNALPWSDELQQMLEERYGREYRKYLPFLVTDSMEKKKSVQFRFDYMDCVSSLYKKNFSDAIGKWCSDHGVEYIGHVVEDDHLYSRLGTGSGHFFRAMSGQHMAGLDTIGNQIMPGAPAQVRRSMMDCDGEFNHFVLGKLGTSCGHLDPKKQGRTMCELFGAYDWVFGVRDMKFVLDHLLVKGVNNLVPHAFSMAEYPDPDCPPHFYARGNNPQYPYFARLMKYGNRMCSLLSNGKHIASVAVLFDAEADWVGDDCVSMQKICRTLIENQIDFDIVCADMLKDPDDWNGEIKDGKLFINGECFEALIVPHADVAVQPLADLVEQNPEFPVIFTDALPKELIGGGSAAVFDGCRAVPLSELPAFLRSEGIYEIDLDQAYTELSIYHYYNNMHILALFNESLTQSYTGNVYIKFLKAPVCYDAMEDKYYSVDHEETENGCSVKLELEPRGCMVLMEGDGILPEETYLSFAGQTARCTFMDISENWSVSRVRSIDYPEFSEKTEMKELKLISEIDPEFSGVICYERELVLDEMPQEAYLAVEHVYETMKVEVNGGEALWRLTPPYQVNIAPFLHPGSNRIRIEVATTPAREQQHYPGPPYDFIYHVMEPTGMCGRVGVYLRS